MEGHLNGARIRKFFPNKEEAEGYRQLKEVEAINGSHEFRPSVTHLTSNPADEVQPVNLARGLPEIITVKLARELMAFLETYTGAGKTPKPAGFLVPYFSLALFAGIRPAINAAELVRIGQLKDNTRFIDLSTGVIRITPDIAKTKDMRQIAIQPNLKAWLKAYPIEKYPISPASAFDEVTSMRQKFSLGHDVLRHTYINIVLGLPLYNWAVTRLIT